MRERLGLFQLALAFIAACGGSSPLKPDGSGSAGRPGDAGHADISLASDSPGSAGSPGDASEVGDVRDVGNAIDLGQASDVGAGDTSDVGTGNTSDVGASDASDVGNTSDAGDVRAPGSGVPAATTLPQLTLAQRRAICDHINERQGGYAKTIACGTDVRETNLNQAECVESLEIIASACPTLTAGDLDDCASGPQGNICTFDAAPECKNTRDCLSSI